MTDIIVADRIKNLREQANFTQAALTRKLGVTRSSVNAWEMGVSLPSTHYLKELASIFNVSADYLLGLDSSSTISVAGLSDVDVDMIYRLVLYIRLKNGEDIQMS
jgi:transcriptional regulator with XRE-family HTH domain